MSVQMMMTIMFVYLGGGQSEGGAQRRRVVGKLGWRKNAATTTKKEKGMIEVDVGQGKGR